MSQRRHSTGWYGRIFQGESRPSTSRSNVFAGMGSINTDLTASLSSSGGSSASNDNNDLSSLRRFKLSRPKINEDIVEILKRNPPSRPRSVALGKYNPLPAICSDSPCPKDASDEESDDSGSEKIQEEEDAEEEFVPPKLVRSGTFDVIETHLESHLVVDSSSEEDNVEEPPKDPLEINDPDGSERILCQVTIDGIPLPEYLSQERRHAIQKTMDISDIPTNYSRPCSTSSLVTHRGSPDMAFSSSYRTLSSLFETRLTSSNSTRSTKYELKPEEITPEEGHYIKFPDNNLMLVRWVHDQSLVDFIKMIQTLRFQDHLIRVDLKNVIREDLSESLTHWGISQDSMIHLLQCDK